MPPWPRRLLVVEDEPLVASLVCDVLRRSGFETLVCPNAAAAVAVVDAFDPDAALLDINLGSGPTGLQLGQLLHRTHPHVGLVFLTKYHDPRVTGRAGWGVPEGSAFLSKDRITDATLLREAVESVLSSSAPKLRDDRIDGGPLNALTDTQLEILRLAALGLTNTAIAKRRGITERSVEQRLQAAYQALGIVISTDVNPRVEAIRRYIAAVGIPTDDGQEEIDLTNA